MRWRGMAWILPGAARLEMRRLAQVHADKLPEEFHTLNALLNWAENGGKWPTITSENPAYFYTLRAAEHADADLINMLLSELCPKDIRQLFICHKQLFYQRYANWSNAKKDYVVDFLVNEYQVDKVGARKALFGRDAPMQQEVRTSDMDEMIDRVGPWGPVRR